VTTAPDHPPVACPCGHGDVPAELVAQRPLLERAAAADPEAFARLWADQADGVHRYLLAWTGDPARAADLTAQVRQSAPRWLPTPRQQVEAGVWLIAMARDATQDPRAAQPPPPGPPRNAIEALARLPIPQREVLVLRLGCGHSLPHTAHLSGYPRRTVLELQLAACLTIRTLLGAPPPVGPPPSAEAFEQHLEGEADPGGDLFLSGALAVAGSLRQATRPAQRARITRPARRRGPRWGSVARPGKLSDRLSTGWRGVPLEQRPWVATGVALAGIVVVLALQLLGDHGPPRACGDRPCPVPTTAVVAAAGAASGLGTAAGAASGLGTAPSSAAGPTTTRATRVAPPAAARASTVATPPTTRPAATAPPTTAAPAPTTTTAPPTTAPPTTAAPTTTTAPPMTT
jgi:DNA-directed RNA polymerase specialized sigma24 family protein